MGLLELKVIHLKGMFKSVSFLMIEQAIKNQLMDSPLILPPYYIEPLSLIMLSISSCSYSLEVMPCSSRTSGWRYPCRPTGPN